MKRVYLFTILILFTQAIALEWVFRDSVEVPVTRTAAVTDGEKIYLICGNTMLPETSYSRVQVYLPGTDSWYIADLVHPGGGVHNHDAEIIGRKIYVGGGSRRSAYYNNLTVINLGDNTWTVVGAMPENNLLYYEFEVADNKIYLFGGAPDGSTPINRVWCFDTTTNTWTQRAAMPQALRDVAAARIGDTIYTFGGFRDANYTAVNACYAYSITGNNWVTKTSMPTARGWATAHILLHPDSGPMVFVCGGQSGSNTYYNTVERYSVWYGTWATQTPMNRMRRSHGGVVLGCSLFVISGYAVSRPFLASVERGFAPEFVGLKEMTKKEASFSLRVTPNPINGMMKVSFFLPGKEKVRIKLYSPDGNLIKTLFDGEGAPGNRILSFPTHGLPSGIYFLRLTTGNLVGVKKVILNP